MRGVLKASAALIGLPLICAPVAFLSTVLCAPFWEWVEKATGLETYGREGPNEVCYLTTFVLLVTVTYLLAWVSWRRRRATRGFAIAVAPNPR